MLRYLFAIGAMGVGVLHSSVVAGCSEGSNCEKGFYCDRESFQCRPCINCESLKRNPSRSFSPCIESVADCGDCIKGLVVDRRSDVVSMCVPPDASAGDDAVPSYVWVVVVLGLFLLAILVFVIVYLLRNTYTLKILASTRTSVEAPAARAGATASAPELPPPYEAPSTTPYNPHCPAPSRDPVTPSREDESWPFIKRVPSQRGADEREAPGRQAARVFNNPRYVRAPHLPSNHKAPTVSYESESTFTVHDEDTMESTWTPGSSADHTDTNGNAVTAGSLGTMGPLALAAPHASHTSHTSHTSHESHEPHAFCAQQDTNNNRNVSEASAGEGPAGAPAAPSFIINVVQNINAVQQHNDVTL